MFWSPLRVLKLVSLCTYHQNNHYRAYQPHVETATTTKVHISFKNPWIESDPKCHKDFAVLPSGREKDNRIFRWCGDDRKNTNIKKCSVFHPHSVVRANKLMTPRVRVTEFYQCNAANAPGLRHILLCVAIRFCKQSPFPDLS